MYIWNLKGYMHITNQGVPWKFASGAENLVSLGSSYVTSSWTLQKTLFPTFLLLLGPFFTAGDDVFITPWNHV
jgi:hypothetical protein